MWLVPWCDILYEGSCCISWSRSCTVHTKSGSPRFCGLGQGGKIFQLGGEYREHVAPNCLHMGEKPNLRCSGKMEMLGTCKMFQCMGHFTRRPPLVVRHCRNVSPKKKNWATMSYFTVVACRVQSGKERAWLVRSTHSARGYIPEFECRNTCAAYVPSHPMKISQWFFSRTLLLRYESRGDLPLERSV